MYEIVGRKALAILNALEGGAPSASVSNDLLDGYIPDIEEWDCWSHAYKPNQIVRYRGILHKVIDAGPEQGFRLSCKIEAV